MLSDADTTQGVSEDTPFADLRDAYSSMNMYSAVLIL